MNEQPTFKAGDEVYCPNFGNVVYKLIKTGSLAFPIGIGDRDEFLTSGQLDIDCIFPAIFHATPENKALLEALYKCEFESPKLKGSDLTRKLLSEGKHVLCYVSFESNDVAVKGRIIRLIESAKGDLFYQSATGGNAYPYAVPCKDYANLADGVLIKSEQ